MARPRIEPDHLAIPVRGAAEFYCWPEAEFLDEIQTKVLRISSLLFIVTFTALPLDFCFFKLTQSLTVSTVQLLYAVKEKEGKPVNKIYPFTNGLRWKNLKSEKS